MHQDNCFPAAGITSALALGSLLVVGACNLVGTPREDRLVTDRSGDIGGLVDGNNAFAVDIYKEVVAGEDGNVFLSPFSISSALAMTYAGAGGTTAEAMASTLHITLEDATYHDAFGRLTRDLDGDYGRGYELSIANRLFGQTGYAFGADFLAINAEAYGAPLETVDYKEEPEASRKTISTWVAEQTQDKIPELIAPGLITLHTRLVLANAIYFKANWNTKFAKSDTSDKPFHTPTGDVSVPMMSMEEKVELAHLTDLSILRLPYEDEELSMVFILPDDNNGLAAIETSLNATDIDDWIASTHLQTTTVHIPRFEMRFATPLKEPLTTMGMGIAFDPNQADFSPMAVTPLCLSEAVHEAYVKVDEEGTEAAAATAVIAYEDTGSSNSFYADHPFLFLIRDDLTGSILFMGRVVDPS